MSWFRLYMRSIFGPSLSKYSVIQLETWLSASRTLYMFSAFSALMMVIHLREKAIDSQEKEALLKGEPYEREGLFSSFINFRNKPETVYEYDKELGWIVKDYKKEASGPRLARETYIKAYKYQKEELEAGRSLPPGALLLVDEKDIKKKSPIEVKKTVTDVKRIPSEPKKVTRDVEEKS